MDAVEAAVVCLMAKEENNVPNIRKIAQRSGYSVGTIYNYYRNSCRTGLALIKSNTKALNPSCLQHLFQGL